MASSGPGTSFLRIDSLEKISSFHGFVLRNPDLDAVRDGEFTALSSESQRGARSSVRDSDIHSVSFDQHKFIRFMARRSGNVPPDAIESS